MKERPILFSGPMVRALLAGTKTQTRRVIKPQPEAEHGGEPYWFVGGYRAWTYRNTTDLLRKGGNVIQCPYGQTGDRLWVRETWADLTETHGQRWERFNEETRRYEHGCDPFIWYRADGDQPDVGDGAVNPERWRPSIHMPRAASRITLEVTGVRVERLQDISIEDAKAEGAWPDVSVVGDCATYFGIDDLAVNPYRAFQMLWERINGRESWQSNPWVWVVEFKRPGGDAS